MDCLLCLNIHTNIAEVEHWDIYGSLYVWGFQSFVHTSSTYHFIILTCCYTVYDTQYICPITFKYCNVLFWTKFNVITNSELDCGRGLFTCDLFIWHDWYFLVIGDNKASPTLFHAIPSCHVFGGHRALFPESRLYPEQYSAINIYFKAVPSW